MTGIKFHERATEEAWIKKEDLSCPIKGCKEKFRNSVALKSHIREHNGKQNRF
jgi:hypothetical protein